MKRKILLISLGILIFSCLFAITAFATVDYGEVATLEDGTTLPIYDENQNPLIWYVSGVDSYGNNIYKSVPNNRNEANGNNDTFVTYTINTGFMTQLENINIHIWNDSLGEYEVFAEENIQVVVVNLRGISSFVYVNKGLKVSDIQYIYFNETLKDFCEYFKGSTALRLVDLSVCTNLSAGFGGTRNLYNCTNLHTIRFAPVVSYTLTCGSNYNWRFGGTAIKELVILENITSIGIDNFKNCTQLESIYILGNTTSLGQRNFVGCSKLTNIYILGDDPQIDVVNFKENFYECVEGNITHDFTSVGKNFFFVSTNYDYLSQVKEAIGAKEIITYNEYIASPSKFTDGRYIISGTNICDVYYGEHKINQEATNNCVGTCDVCDSVIINHQETEELVATIEYSNYTLSGVKTTSCKNAGCTYSQTAEVPPLFTCLGYSASEIGGDGIAIGYMVNNEAIDEYTNITGKSLTYGVFVASQSKLGNNDIFDQEGNKANGVVSVEITGYEFIAFELKIIGFTDENKDKALAMGAYVAVTTEGVTEYAYMQDSEPDDGEKYSYVTYNGIVNK